MHGARGRVGNVVGYQREGTKLMRALPTSVKNPQTDAQTITRLAFSSAAKTAQHLRSIIDHSFQGVTYGQKSVNYFTSKLAKEIREFVKSAMAAGSTVAPFGTAPVLPYMAGGVAAGAKALISSGDLPSVPYDFLSGSTGGWYIGNDIGNSDLGILTLSEFESVFGVPLTDQLTFVSGAPVELDYISETELFYGVRFNVKRVNFATFELDLELTKIFDMITSGVYKLSPDIIDWSRSDASFAQGLRFTTSQGRLIVYSGEAADRMDPTGAFHATDVCLAAVIVSRYENNAWRRSTTRLIQNPKTITQSAVSYEQNYAYNDIDSVLALAAPKKAGVEDRYLNKELN